MRIVVTKDVPRSVKAMVMAMATSTVAGKKRFLGKRTTPIHTMTSTAFKTQFVTAAAEKVTLPRIVPAKVKAKARTAKAKEKVAKATLEKVTVRTCPKEDGKQKVDGRDPKETKAKVKGTRVHAGDAGKSATSKVSARPAGEPQRTSSGS